MLDYSIMDPEGILLLKPDAPLSKEDFGGLGATVDSYLSDHAKHDDARRGEAEFDNGDFIGPRRVSRFARDSGGIFLPDRAPCLNAPRNPIRASSRSTVAAICEPDFIDRVYVR